MKNVGMKPESYRIAKASAELLAPAHCIQLLADGNTEKGDALKTARIAGILAAKRTDELIPLCHPLPIYRADVEFELLEDRVVIYAEVETIGPTGVEMEALTAASLAGLTISVSFPALSFAIDTPVDYAGSRLKHATRLDSN